MKAGSNAMLEFGRIPKHPEWRLLRALVDDVTPYIDANDRKVIIDIVDKRDFQRYLELGEYWGLQSIDPVHHCSTVSRNASLYLLSSFLKKWRCNDANLEETTIETFLSYEAHCYAYNKEGYRELSWSDDATVQLHYARMMLFIEQVLGTNPDIDEILIDARHGPGRTVHLSSRYGNRFYKNNRLPYEVTADALPLARRVIASDDRWRCAITEHFSRDFHEIANSELFRVVPGNLVMFVPKDAKSLRTIAAEPAMNIYIQLGVDGFIRRRLKRFGVDINDQTFNQRLAYLGSIDNSYATLDLKGASDTVSLRLIEKLLPLPWVELLYKLRCDTGTLPDGRVIRYNKISSMGNGYTFALETLIFAAAVFAVGGSLGDDSHVYGDDIALPTKHVPALKKLLGCCGFLINHDKSFVDPTFTRESCGADFEAGVNIRPVFLKEPLATQNAFEIYSLHNKLLKWFDNNVGHIEAPTSCGLLVGWTPVHMQLFGPPDPLDLSSYFVSRIPGHRSSQYGYVHDRAVAVPRYHKVCEEPEEGSIFSDFANSCLWLQHDLKDCTSDEGTKFAVTQRNDYKIVAKRGCARVFAWPTTFLGY